MKHLGLPVMFCLVLVPLATAQQETISVCDFEMDVGTWSGFVTYADFSMPDEPRHGGEASVMLDVLQEGGWNDARWTLPEPVDISEADEFHLWVYSDQIFRLRTDPGVELPLGFRYYGPDDVGTWKEFVYWISEEQSTLWQDLLSSMSSMRFWINPDPETEDGVDYPDGFEGLVYMDDITARKRVPVEREYLPLIGFNDKADEDLVSLEYGSSFFEVDTTGYPEPREGTGTLVWDFTSGWSENISINLRDYPQIADYDRIHLDIFVDGDPSNWAACALVLRTSWVDADGNSHGTGWAGLSENILGYAVGDWGELSGQYGPVDSEGFVFNWLKPEVVGVFDDPDGTISLMLTSQGADGLDGTYAYIDNIRLSRPVGTSIPDWELR
jgi:hypothetical protein